MTPRFQARANACDLRKRFAPNFHAGFGDHGRKNELLRRTRRDAAGGLASRPAGTGIGAFVAGGPGKLRADWHNLLAGGPAGIRAGHPACGARRVEGNSRAAPGGNPPRVCAAQTGATRPAFLPRSHRPSFTCCARNPCARKSLKSNTSSSDICIRNLILWKSRFLAGMPVIRFMGSTARRLSAALAEGRHWRPFNIKLCPAIAGIQLLKDGGYLTLTLDSEARRPAEFQFHPLPRQVHGAHEWNYGQAGSVISGIVPPRQIRYPRSGDVKRRRRLGKGR